MPEPSAADELQYLTEAEFRAREKQNLIAALRAANWRVWGTGWGCGDARYQALDTVVSDERVWN